MTAPVAIEVQGASRRRQIASLLALLLVAAVGTGYVLAHRDRFAVLLRVPPVGVGALVALAVLGWAARAAILRTAMRGMGAQVTRLESNLLT